MDKQEHRYDNSLSLTNKELGEALTDPAFDAKRDFGEKVYNDLVAEAGRRLKVNYPEDGPNGKPRDIPKTSRRRGVYSVIVEKTADGSEWWHEFESKEQRDKFIMERRIWTHYDHAREKHPYFCDRISIGNSRSIVTAALRGYRKVIKEQIEKGELYWGNVLNCEMLEVIEALERGNDPAAVEECYDVIAVMLRVIDVLEGRQPLGKPAPKTPTLPPKSSAAPETERKTTLPLGKPPKFEESFAMLAELLNKSIREFLESDENIFDYPPIDPDYGTMRCCCPFRKGATNAH